MTTDFEVDRQAGATHVVYGRGSVAENVKGMIDANCADIIIKAVGVPASVLPLRLPHRRQ